MCERVRAAGNNNKETIANCSGSQVNRSTTFPIDPGIQTQKHWACLLKYLACDCKRMAELRLPCAELAEYLSDGAGLNPACTRKRHIAGYSS